MPFTCAMEHAQRQQQQQLERRAHAGVIERNVRAYARQADLGYANFRGKVAFASIGAHRHKNTHMHAHAHTYKHPCRSRQCGSCALDQPTAQGAQHGSQAS
jgi:hypothetical protein